MMPYDREEIGNRFAGCISVRFDNYPPPKEITSTPPPQPVLRRDTTGATELAAVSNAARHAQRRAEVKASVCITSNDGQHDWRGFGTNRAGVARVRCAICKISYSDQ